MQSDTFNHPIYTDKSNITPTTQQRLSQCAGYLNRYISLIQRIKYNYDINRD